MPIIPRANPADVTAIGSLPTVRNNAEVRPVTGLADAVAGLTGQALKIHQDAVERNDATAVMAARRQLSDWEAKTFDPANPDGITKYQGGNALGADEALMPDLDKTVSGISSGLTPRQQRAFDVVATNFRESVQNRLTSHMTQQHEVFLQAQDKATTDTLQNDAVTASIGGDWATGKQRLDEGVSAIRLSMGHRGMPTEAVDNAVRGYVSGYHKAVLDSMLSSDPSQALSYLGDHQDELTADDRIQVEKVLRPIATEDTARKLVDARIAGGGTSAAGAPMEGAATTPAQVEAVARASVERTVGLESGGKANAKNPTSSATGAAQFVDGTWLDVMTRYRPDLTRGKSRAEILALRSDPALSKEMATQYAIENCKGLFESGLPVTPETAYLCHHFGLAGARNLLRADPNTPVKAVLDPQSYAANAYLHGKTVAEVLGNHAARAGEAGGASAPAAPAAAPRAIGADGKPDYAALEAWARDLPNPLLRKATLADIEQRRLLQDRKEADYREQMATSLYQAVETVPPGTPYAQAFTPEQQAYMRDHGLVDNFQARLKARTTGALIQSNVATVDALERMAVEDPAGFAKVNLYERADQLGTADLQSLAAKQAAIRKGDTAAQADWSNDQQRITTILRTLGTGDGAPKAGAKGNASSLKASDPKVAAVGSAYRQALAAFITAHGKPTPAQKDELMRQVQTNIARDIASGGWDKVVRQQQAGELKAGADDAARAAARFRARYGRDPSYAEINTILRTAYQAP